MFRYAIGDVHGCYDELLQALNWIDADTFRRNGAEYQIILLGDYVDRGPNSKGVIELLCQRNLAFPGRFVFIKGNHDTAFEDVFRMSPLFDYTGWFNTWGGAASIASYGSRDKIANDNPHHVNFFMSMVSYHETPNHIFAHAGLSPGVPLEEMSDTVLQWSRDHSGHGHEKMFVHGHTPKDKVELGDDHINLDTGCCFGGYLTVGVFEDSKRYPVHIEEFRTLATRK